MRGATRLLFCLVAVSFWSSAYTQETAPVVEEVTAQSIIEPATHVRIGMPAAELETLLGRPADETSGTRIEADPETEIVRTLSWYLGPYDDMLLTTWVLDDLVIGSVVYPFGGWYEAEPLPVAGGIPQPVAVGPLPPYVTEWEPLPVTVRPTAPAAQPTYRAPTYSAPATGNCPQGGNHVRGKVDRNGRVHCAKCGQFM